MTGTTPPLNKDKVPHYYNVISSPIDLSAIEERLDTDFYTSPKELVGDLKLIVIQRRDYSKRKVYNPTREVYVETLIKDIPESHDLHEG
ncbi:Acyl-CoA N-acyltransferase [Penicillium rubens]|nr:Acyl-CoA N-acyltransferase [Penicillium rubens]